jgi:hypothetical protein
MYYQDIGSYLSKSKHGGKEIIKLPKRKYEFYGDMDDSIEKYLQKFTHTKAESARYKGADDDLIIENIIGNSEDDSDDEVVVGDNLSDQDAQSNNSEVIVADLSEVVGDDLSDQDEPTEGDQDGSAEIVGDDLSDQDGPADIVGEDFGQPDSASEVSSDEEINKGMIEGAKDDDIYEYMNSLILNY